MAGSPLIQLVQSLLAEQYTDIPTLTGLDFEMSALMSLAKALKESIIGAVRNRFEPLW